MKSSLWVLIGGIALPAALLVAPPPARAAQPPDAVKITKMPVKVQHRTFDPRRPPREMPELKPPENAVCASDFLSDASVGGQAAPTDATHATLTINRVEVTLQLNITIWVPQNPPQTVVEHEEGHRQIAEYFYKNADAVARLVAQPYLGKTIQVSGRDLRKAVSVALGKAGEEITNAYNKGMPVELAEARFDEITDHSRKDIPVPDAIAQAIRETAPASIQPAPVAATMSSPPTNQAQGPSQPNRSQPSLPAALAEIASQNDIRRTASAGESGTPAATAKIATSAGKYDILGIKLGMPIKEALLVLKAHSPKFRLQPESVKYDVLPDPLTYGISAVSSNVIDPSRPLPPNSEKLYFMITMPPNQEVVSKLSRIVTFAKDTVPTQDVLATELEKKYGPVSWDSGSATLNQQGYREMLWVDDEQGARLQGRDILDKCRLMTTFRMGQDGPSDVRVDPVRAKARVEGGYVNQQEGMARECGSYTMVRAQLYDSRALGISTPGLVAGLMVMIASGPLDRSATDGTHQYLLQATKARDLKQEKEASKNRPKL